MCPVRGLWEYRRLGREYRGLWPEAKRYDLKGVGLARDPVGAFPLRGASARESGDGQVEAVPEGAPGYSCLQSVPRTPENVVCPRQYPAVALHVLLVVGGVLGVFLEEPILVFEAKWPGIIQSSVYAKGV